MTAAQVGGSGGGIGHRVAKHDDVLPGDGVRRWTGVGYHSRSEHEGDGTDGHGGSAHGHDDSFVQWHLIGHIHKPLKSTTSPRKVP